jgi:hypothetical protein
VPTRPNDIIGAKRLTAEDVSSVIGICEGRATPLSSFRGARQKLPVASSLRQILTIAASSPSLFLLKYQLRKRWPLSCFHAGGNWADRHYHRICRSELCPSLLMHRVTTLSSAIFNRSCSRVRHRRARARSLRVHHRRMRARSLEEPPKSSLPSLSLRLIRPRRLIRRGIGIVRRHRAQRRPRQMIGRHPLVRRHNSARKFSQRFLRCNRAFRKQGQRADNRSPNLLKR